MIVFDPSFWGGSYWQGIGVMVSFLSCFLSPLLTKLYDHLTGKEKDQKNINAYKALLLPDRPLSPGETLRFIFVQAAVSYGLYLVARRLFLISPSDPNTLLVLCGGFVFLSTWGLSFARHKSFAKLITWQFCTAFAIFVLLLLGQKGNTPITENYTWLKHAIGQYLSPGMKQWPVISSLRALSLKAVPVDFRPHSPISARNTFLIIYGLTLAFFLLCYTFFKRHHASQVSAFYLLSEKERKDRMELTEYELKEKELEIKGLEKQEREVALDLNKLKAPLILERERMEVESTRLDIEKKRLQYTLELATQLIDTLYVSGEDPMERAELLRNILSALKDFGHPGQESTSLILAHLQYAGDQPKAIPATITQNQ